MPSVHDILKCLSHHLSSYKGEFDVCIIDDRIYMYPDIYVFPDPHHRKCTDRENLICHIFTHHYPHCINSLNFDSVDMINVRNIDSSNMKYRYMYSMNHKYRKWLRIL